MHPHLPVSGWHITNGKSASPNLPGFGKCVRGHCQQQQQRPGAAGGFSGAERGRHSHHRAGRDCAAAALHVAMETKLDS